MLNYISAPFKWFFKLEAASGLILLISAIIASGVVAALGYIWFQELGKT